MIGKVSYKAYDEHLLSTYFRNVLYVDGAEFKVYEDEFLANLRAHLETIEMEKRARSREDQCRREAEEHSVREQERHKIVRNWHRNRNTVEFLEI